MPRQQPQAVQGAPLQNKVSFAVFNFVLMYRSLMNRDKGESKSSIKEPRDRYSIEYLWNIGAKLDF